jgi:hypothetical protein
VPFGTDTFGFGLVTGSTECSVVIDAVSPQRWGDNECRSGITIIDDSNYLNNNTKVLGRLLDEGRSHTIMYTVRKAARGEVAVTAEVDGKKFLDWTGDASRLSLGEKDPIVKAGKERLFWFHSHRSIFVLTKLELRPPVSQPNAEAVTVNDVKPPIDHSSPPPPHLAVSSEHSPSLPGGAILVMTFDNNTVFTKDGSVFVKDLSGRGNLGEIHGASFVRGKVGNALKFDGHDWVSVSGEYPSGASPRTIAAWVRCDKWQDAHMEVVVMYGDPPQGRAFAISLWPDVKRSVWPNKVWGIHGHMADLITTLSADTRWHHHAITYDGAEGAYYCDGQQVARGPLQYLNPKPPHSKQPTRPLRTAASPMAFGNNLTDPKHLCFFRGTLDEVVVYDRVLAAEEIKTLYQMGLNGEALAEYR